MDKILLFVSVVTFIIVVCVVDIVAGVLRRRGAIVLVNRLQPVLANLLRLGGALLRYLGFIRGFQLLPALLGSSGVTLKKLDQKVSQFHWRFEEILFL